MTDVETAQADLDRATAALRSAFATRDALTLRGRAADGSPRRREGVAPDDFAAALDAVAAARRDEEAALRRLTDARAAAAPAPLTQAEQAAEAVRLHEEAVVAHATAEAAFAARDAAWSRAGCPGTDWRKALHLGARPELDGGVAVAAQIHRARINAFDVAALKRVADGEAPTTAPTRLASPPGFHDQSRAFDADLVAW